MERPLLTLLTLLACQPVEPGPLPLGAISPADGQSGVARELPLRVAGPFDFPADHPVPQAVQVIHIGGEPVPGQATVDEGVLTFHPQLPWEVGATYSWTVQSPLPTTRGPVLDLPSHVLGSATFHTHAGLAVLAAGWSAPDRLCVVLSRPAEDDELSRLRATLDDQPVTLDAFQMLDDEALGQSWRFPLDDGLGGVCFTPVDAPPNSARVRVWLGDQPWLYALERAQPAQLADRLRRVTP